MWRIERVAGACVGRMQQDCWAVREACPESRLFPHRSPVDLLLRTLFSAIDDYAVMLQRVRFVGSAVTLATSAFLPDADIDDEPMPSITELILQAEMAALGR